MISSEQTARIACSFISAYYKRFVDDLPSLAEFYGESSSTSFARVGEAVATTSQGKHEVQQYLERLSTELGPRKVQVRHADFVPTTDGSIAVTVNGVLFTKCLRQVFSQTFVLTQTKYRENVMYISADSLRFTSKETEVIPANAIVIAPGQESSVVAPVATATTLPPPRSSGVATTAAATNAAPIDGTSQQPQQERKERPPRKERAPRIRNVNDATPAADGTPANNTPAPSTTPAAPVAAPQTMAEKIFRERKPRDAPGAMATPAAAEERPPRRSEKSAPRSAPMSSKSAVVAAPQQETSKSAPSTGVAAALATAVTAAPSDNNATRPAERSLTSKVRLVKVPKDIRLSNVRSAVAKYGKVVDAFWVGEASDDAVVAFATPDEARALQADRAFAINEKLIRRNFYFDAKK